MAGQGPQSPNWIAGQGCGSLTGLREVGEDQRWGGVCSPSLTDLSKKAEKLSPLALYSRKEELEASRGLLGWGDGDGRR
jgi:hypothetical protein